MTVPVYLFTGFLESGKTTLIKETLLDAGFNTGERTLLLACEEGMEEYDDDFLVGQLYLADKRVIDFDFLSAELPPAFPVKGFRFVDNDFLHKLP